MSADGGMGTRDAVYPGDGVFPALRQEANSDSCSNMDEP